MFKDPLPDMRQAVSFYRTELECVTVEVSSQIQHPVCNAWHFLLLQPVPAAWTLRCKGMLPTAWSAVLHQLVGSGVAANGDAMCL
jgi:hypothetical protein